MQSSDEGTSLAYLALMRLNLKKRRERKSKYARKSERRRTEE